jgi:hypothetical protein
MLPSFQMEEPNSRALKPEQTKVESWGFDACAWLACMAYLWAMKGLQKELYLWDSAILWDGAARMAQGLSPFTDFGMPVGPVSLWLPSLFFKAFGTSWPVFKMAQLFINGLMLASLLILFRQMGQGSWVRLIGACLFSVGYLALLWAPWYNTTALLLVFVSLNLLHLKGALSRLVLGMTVGVCMFTKQDFGLLLMVFGVVHLAWTAQMKLRPVPELRADYGLYFCGLGLGVLIMVLQYEWVHLSYWLNFGQPHQSKRIPQWTQMLRRDVFLGAALVFCAFKFANRMLFTWALVVLMAWVTVLTSGQLVTHFYALWVLPLVMFYKDLHPAWRWFRWVLTGMCLLMLLPIAKHASVYIRSVAAGQVIHPMFHDTWLKQGSPVLVDLGTCEAQRHRVFGSPDSCRLVADLHKLKRERNFKHGGFILNFSEATQLAEMLNLRAPQGHPLWYHGGISYFPIEHQRVLKEIDSGLYEVIVLTDWGPDYKGLEAQVMAAVQRSSKYSPAGATYESSFGLSNCLSRSMCRISVYVRAGQ